MNSIIFVRHGQALHNVTPDLWSLNVDDALGLTELGVRQAAFCGERISKELEPGSRVQVFCSDQIRARQTASIIRGSLLTCPDLECDPVLEEDIRLREFHYVNNGYPLIGFDFSAFVQDPLRSYTCSLSTSKARCILTVAQDVWGCCYDRSQFQDIQTILVSHHFTISAALAMNAIGGDLSTVKDRLAFAQIVVNINIPHATPISMDSLDPETVSKLRGC